MQLSERLSMNVSLVPQGAKVADIGCDHGYASIWLVEQKAAQTVIAMDVNEGPLERAREHIRRAGLEDKIVCRRSNGAEKLIPGEVDTLMIAGMGGPLMIQILREAEEVLQKVAALVLQPQSEICDVRKYLLDTGFIPEEEKACIDSGKYYFAMRAVRQNPEHPVRWKEEWQYRYGTYLVQKRDTVLKQFLLNEQKKYSEILANPEWEGEPSERRTELQHRMNEIDKCLAKMCY